MTGPAYRIDGPARRRKCDQVLELVDLGYKRDALVTSLSRGMTQRLGLARVLEQPGMTMSGEFVGTPAYMSPEQITAGRMPLDQRTHIYSLGSTH